MPKRAVNPRGEPTSAFSIRVNYYLFAQLKDELKRRDITLTEWTHDQIEAWLMRLDAGHHTTPPKDRLTRPETH
jgi:hypothetical protein